MSCSVLLIANQTVRQCFLDVWMGHDALWSSAVCGLSPWVDWLFYSLVASVLNSFISLCNLKASGYAITSLSFTLPVMLKKQKSAKPWVDHSFGIGLDNTAKVTVAVFPRWLSWCRLSWVVGFWQQAMRRSTVRPQRSSCGLSTVVPISA